ncbi:uncharacterized protein LOC121366933 [Gigantopelta aegis]|uniref:uncharacterized protein LOC121366933 n=1 Tax=Gigantopelta aegis TaxID=1735272 RepID=UPI001B887456|nr:uncharacterized protein LOC121366933 [Gigantopelta aegis]
MSRAPSCWMRYADYHYGDIIMQDVSVPTHGDTPNTYYCTLQWNAGHEAGGYCGIQSHTHGRKNYIFSLWKSRSHPDIPIGIPYKGHGTTTTPFGGEGTGMKSMNYSLGWKDNHWYTTVVRRWHHQQHTYFGFWIHDQSANSWAHLVTMDYPASADFYTQTGSFIEDWAGSGQHQREVHFRHGFKRRTDQTWIPFTTTNFSDPTTTTTPGCNTATTSCRAAATPRRVPTWERARRSTTTRRPAILPTNPSTSPSPPPRPPR